MIYINAWDKKSFNVENYIYFSSTLPLKYFLLGLHLDHGLSFENAWCVWAACSIRKVDNTCSSEVYTLPYPLVMWVARLCQSVPHFLSGFESFTACCYSAVPYPSLGQWRVMTKQCNLLRVCVWEETWQVTMRHIWAWALTGWVAALVRADINVNHLMWKWGDEGRYATGRDCSRDRKLSIRDKRKHVCVCMCACGWMWVCVRER